MTDQVTGVAAEVIAEARGWIGTPYRHQGRRKGVGCDCLGLLIGVWRAVYGQEPESAGPYTADWGGGGRRRPLPGGRAPALPGEAAGRRGSWRSHPVPLASAFARQACGNPGRTRSVRPCLSGPCGDRIGFGSAVAATHRRGVRLSCPFKRLNFWEQTLATILLQAAGSFLGGFLGPIGSAIGSAAGAMAGYLIDRTVIDGTKRIEGPRLAGARPFSAEEGASLPRVYGAARIGGTVIWATRFEETAHTRRQGAKGGPRVTEYSYFANVAFALCKGEIAGIRRIWADGRELDRTAVEMRAYRGTEDQMPDPLIEAKQGVDNTPAYRGTAYVVFERLPLGDYGNRIPQLQFEVLRPVGNVHNRIRAVCLIPGATEYGLSPQLVTRKIRPGETEAVNRHVYFAGTDLDAALDELQMLCPALEDIALVASWFGSDLRAGHCTIRPMVTHNDVQGISQALTVSGLGRTDALEVSRIAGAAAYGGTPSDRSIMDAIAAIRARGLKVTLYPFIMMDVPTSNDLTNPYGGEAQPAYPWRGRITCDPAPLVPGSADKSAAARVQIAAFCGSAASADFAQAANTILFSGDPDDWGYRRFILHFAHLAVAAGGVDAFFIGSELRGLTTLRDETNAFPFVEELSALAEEIAAILGPQTKLTYCADWSEYFGHQPADGSGDVFFHLDPLWAHPDIDAIGIDSYMPLSDWRDEDYAGGNPDGFSGPYDPGGLAAAIAGGEGFDWYYASAEAREARERSSISDGAYGKPWVYRYKDLVGWWSNQHYDRVGGVEQAEPTAWVPQSKPFWLTELGCPAADKGPNQPNVFSDPKSVENALPYFSNGGRSDLAQQRFLKAHFDHWEPDAPGFVESRNPVSPVYGSRMLDPSHTYLWAWDARPFPAFPSRSDRWGDGGNWHLGHWLNGRLVAAPTGDLINAILADHGLPPADVDLAEGTVHGYVVADPVSARAALEPIVDLFGLALNEAGETFVFRRENARGGQAHEVSDLVAEGQGGPIETVRTPDHDLPVEVVLGFREPMADYQSGSVRQRRQGAAGSRQHMIAFPGTMEGGQAQALADDWLRRVWSQREMISFATARPEAETVAGSIIRVPASGSDADFLITETEDGLVRRIRARQVLRLAQPLWRAGRPGIAPPPNIVAGPPHALLLDLPMGLTGGAPEAQFRVAVWQRPWKSQLVYASPETTGFALRASVARPATLGQLVEALASGVEGRVDRSSSVTVELFDGEVASVSRLQLLNGADAAAVRSASGAWEVLQFETADEIAPDVWRLSGLLRGQLGTNDAMAAGAPAGADFVIFDQAVQSAGLLANEVGLMLNWRVGPSGGDFSSSSFASVTAAGGMRARLPLAPVHLRGRVQAEGGLALSWIRRGRLDADDWAPADIPLGEEHEEYRVEIAPAGGAVVRSVTVTEPAWSYGPSDIAADFDVPSAEIDVSVRQLSVAAGWGLAASERFALP